MTETKTYHPSEYRKWSYTEYGSISCGADAEGTFEEVKAELQVPRTYSAWEDVEDLMEEIADEAKKDKVEGLTFSVYSDRIADYDIVVVADGYVRLTDKQKLAQEKKAAKDALAEATALRKKIKQEKQQLAELLKKYPQDSK